MTTPEQQGFTEGTQRNLSDAEIRTFQEHGVVRVRGAVTPDWIDRMIPIIDEQMTKPSQWSGDTNPGGQTGRFLHDRYLWPEHGGFRHFVFHSGVGRLAAQALRSSTARIYFDHIFVKEPETAETFMWHQDIPYWPFRGSQICSVWLALTAADVESSSLEFVTGSDRTGKLYKPVLPAGFDTELKEWIGKSDEEVCPDFNVLRDRYEIISFDVEAGDALIFNTRIVHSSRGNSSRTRRRVALSTRWLGDDAMWDPRPGTDPIVTQEHVCIRPGEYAAKDEMRFPLVYPTSKRP